MLTYKLLMCVPDDTNPEGIAQSLELAAAQVRRMSSTRAAHSMVQQVLGGEGNVLHGIMRPCGTDTPG